MNVDGECSVLEMVNIVYGLVRLLFNVLASVTL